MDYRKDCNTVHWKYLVGMLFVIIIFLATKNFSQNDRLVENISFAASIASLILAVLAIVQTMFSTESFYRNTQEINNAAENLSKNAQDFSKSSEGILGRLNDFGEGISSIQSSINEVSKKQGDLLAGVNVAPNTTTTAAERKRFSDDFVPEFLQRISLLGLAILYMLKLSKDKNKAFKLQDFKETMFALDTEYSYGFFVATAATSLISYDRTSDGLFRTTDIDRALNEKIEDAYAARALKHDQQHPKSTNSAIKEKILIEQFFSKVS